MPTRREQIRLEGRERVKDKDVEQGRRAMSVVSNLSHSRADAGLDGFDADLDHLNRDFGGGGEENDLGGFEHGDFQLDLDFGAGNDGQDPLATPAKKKQRTDKGREGTVDALATPARSVLSALAKDELPTYHSEGSLAVFDDVSAGVAPSMAGTATPSQSQSQAGVSQSLGTETEALAAGAESVTQKSGSISLQSKNTRKAVRVLKDQVGEQLEEPVEFEKVAEKVSLVSAGCGLVLKRQSIAR